LIGIRDFHAIVCGIVDPVEVVVDEAPASVDQHGLCETEDRVTCAQGEKGERPHPHALIVLRAGVPRLSSLLHFSEPNRAICEVSSCASRARGPRDRAGPVLAILLMSRKRARSLARLEVERMIR
jgi:hypothetical protein